jgi:hypothetical protein
MFWQERTNSNDVTKTKTQQKLVVLQSPPRITPAPFASFTSFHSNALFILHQPPALAAGFTH